MSKWDRSVDFIVIGSGGGGLCAALAAKDTGADVLILEKEDKIGGSTAMSGGVVWVPANPLMLEDGEADSIEKGLEYLETLIGESQPGSTPPRRRAFLENGPKIIEYLRSRKGIRFLRDDRPDYYDELPGGSIASRSLVVKLFNSRALGKWQHQLRAGPIPLPVQGSEARLMTLAGRTPKGAFVAVKVYARKLISKLLGRELFGIGAALQGRMLEAVVKAGIPLEINSKVIELITENDRVTGVVIDRNGARERLQARRGVLIAAGGFARNQEMRERWHIQPSSAEWSNANPGDTGELIEMACELGASVHNAREAVWMPSSKMPGRKTYAIHATELAKPHLIVVDQSGRRFYDEACSYVEAGQKMYAAGAVPCWAIMDSRYRASYNWGKTPPRLTPASWTDSGYMKTAPTLRELAAECGIDAEGLEATVARFNEFAETGKDLDFHRGNRAYDRYWGDPTVKPNPTLGPVRQPPFYAVAIYPGDVGTFGGLVTDEHGQVLRQDGSTIQGLYATGNATASVFANFYPGAGASIAASFIFGYLSAIHATQAESSSSDTGSHTQLSAANKA